MFKNKKLTFNTFLDKAQVRVNTKLVTLNDYIKQPRKEHITMERLKHLYNMIINKEKYLKGFFATSLKIKEEIGTMNKVQPMKKNEFNKNFKINFKNLIRNLHFEQILEKTSSGVNNLPTYLRVAKDFFNNLIIDYKLLSNSGLDFITKGRFGSVLSSFYFRASILNPYLVYSLNKSLLHGKRIFTPTLGWSSYAYGFLECLDVEEYVGTDVIPSVCKKTENLCSMFRGIKSEIFCTPSENLMKSSKFKNKYKEHFDVVFFSPPYFQLEMYEGKKQSTTNYKTYDEWLKKYWIPTVELCNFVLEKNGVMCYIISDYGSNNTSQNYELVKDTKELCKEYFHKFSIQPLYNKNVHVTKHRDTNEKIIICKKK